MTTHTRIACTLHDIEGSLLRMLGVLERRGCRFTAVHASSQDGILTVDIRCTYQRSMQNILEQILKLEDVLSAQEINL